MTSDTTQDCPRCKGTGKLHGEYRYEVSQSVKAHHGAHWYEGIIVERRMHPAIYGGFLSARYLVDFKLKNGDERQHWFGDSGLRSMS